MTKTNVFNIANAYLNFMITKENKLFIICALKLH